MAHSAETNGKRSSFNTFARRSVPRSSTSSSIKGLGFTRMNQIVEREDTPSIRGMVAKVPHLVRYVE